MTESVVDEIEEYIHVKSIDTIFRAILVKCFRDRPANPVAFVMEYLISNYPNEIPASMRVAERAGDELSVDVFHPDPAQHQYLNDTLDIASLFKFLAAQLADAQPDDPVGFIEGAVHSIKNQGSKNAEEI